MAASAWAFYYTGKKYIGSADADLNATTSWQIQLHTSASNAASVGNLTVIGSVTNEVASGNGYSTSGKQLAGITWTTGASASEYRWNWTAVIWTATGGAINNIKHAVIWYKGASAGARKLLVTSQLSTAQFNLSTGNTLTITPSANGVFELN